MRFLINFLQGKNKKNQNNQNNTADITVGKGLMDQINETTFNNYRYKYQDYPAAEHEYPATETEAQPVRNPYEIDTPNHNTAFGYNVFQAIVGDAEVPVEEPDVDFVEVTDNTTDDRPEQERPDERENI